MQPQQRSDHFRHPHRPRKTAGNPGFSLLLITALSLGTGAAQAVPINIYDTGTLNFSTRGQSMWSSGSAFQRSESVFLGTEWNNRTVGVGGIIGERKTTSINTNPGWWAWKGCKETVNFLCGDEPGKGQVKVVTDTRTGARLDLTTSGKFGLEFGYTVDSGSIDADVAFSAVAQLPDRIDKNTFFNLNPSASLDDGLLLSQSPRAEATMNAIAQLSGSVSARACLILSGCTGTATASLPTLDANQPILKLDPNSLKVVPDLLPPNNPGEPRRPLAEVKLANQELTLEGALDATGTPGFKLTTSQFTLADTTPPSPDISLDLASIEFQLPEIVTSGGVQGDVLRSGGRDDFLSPRIDIDGVASMAGFPPLGINLNLIDSGGFKVGASLDALDIDAGPDIGITQDFELRPTLMARLDFSNPILIKGLNGLQDFWEGRWDLLPEFALQETTTITPTFWIEAMLTNSMGIDLGLTGTMDILKLSFGASVGSVDLISSNPISLNNLLGLGNELFSTDKWQFNVADTSFALGGFSPVTTSAFTLAVPEPRILVLLLAGIPVMLLVQRRTGRQSFKA